MIALGIVLVGLPFAIAIGRFLGTSRHIFLPDDLALIDLNVRGALRWQQQLGPYDRFGWNHPGPVYFYLLSIPARIFGAGARADFVGATAINAVAGMATVGVVGRRAGWRAALWTASVVGVLALVLGSTSPGASTFSESALGATVSPWNPDIVIFPLVLFGVLCAAACAGSARHLLGAALVGTFAVQTNIATLPVVAVLFVVATGAAAVAKLTRMRQDRHVPDAERSVGGDQARRRLMPALCAVGILLLLLAWLPPILQEVNGHPGNMTLIWRFFREHHPPGTLGSGLWTILAVDGVLLFGLPQEMTFVLGAPHQHAWLVLWLVLIVGAGAVALGAVRRSSFAVGLGVASLLGIATAIEAATRIVGPTVGYLVLWEIALPIVGIVGVGVGLFGVASTGSSAPSASAPVVTDGRVPAAWSTQARRLSAGLLAVLAITVSCAVAVEMADLPPLQRASDPSVAAAWTALAPHLAHVRGPVFVVDAGVSLPGIFTYFGVVDELAAHGYRPFVSRAWGTDVGWRYVSNGGEPLHVVLFTPTAAVTRMPGYVGHTEYADIVIEQRDRVAGRPGH